MCNGKQAEVYETDLVGYSRIQQCQNCVESILLISSNFRWDLWASRFLKPVHDGEQIWGQTYFPLNIICGYYAFPKRFQQ